GDMIEANALGDLHRAGRDAPCLLGSIKGNIGHTEGAAGIASLIKTSLALSRRVLPPTVAAAGPNPALRLDRQGLTLATTAAKLGEGPVIAGVSSFGIGGSNVHLLLTTPPATATVIRVFRDDGVGVVTVSAHSSDALRRNTIALANTLDECNDDDVAALCYTSNHVKSSLEHRFAAAGTRNELIGALLGYDMSARTEKSRRRGGRLRIGLLCTGQGAQYPGMTQALYRSCPPYREHLTRAAAAVDTTFAGPNGLLTSMFRGGDVIHTTEHAQPALFAVSYAIGAALLDLGVEPTFLIGHSVGEFAAAALAEVLTLEEAAGLVVARGAVMQQLPTGGAMSAVDVPAEQVANFVAEEPTCGIAAINGPASTVVSGAADAVDRITTALARGGAKVTSLPVSHAFHSPLMTPAQEAFRAITCATKPRKATIPLISTLHGMIVDGTDMDADYWAAQLISTVRFADAMRTATTQASPTHLVELGPRATLLAHARRNGIDMEAATLAPCVGPDDDGAGFARVVARLYSDGLTTQFDHLYDAESRTLKRLPPYVFGDGSRFWRVLDTAAVTGSASTATSVSAAEPGPASDISKAAPLASRIRQLIADVGGYTVEQIDPNALLGADLGYDSLLQLRLIDSVRTEYPELQAAPLGELLSAIESVDDVVRYVTDRLAEIGR
ncbi:MAG TPA: acyltransferase domain-containing protein, partial [Mycobacterium sp.]|nr:acyltransferase domain-containing protein [Mycobacterium sp.]